MSVGPKVVIADDSELARSLVILSLCDLGLTFIEAATGNEVIRALNKQKPDLAILDISMPYPDGLTLLRMIREDKNFHDLPVIICSVENGPEIRKTVQKYTLSAFFTKPFNPDQLRETVTQVLSLTKP